VPSKVIDTSPLLLEKVVAERIIHDVGSSALILSTQFRARPDFTIDARLYLTHGINHTHLSALVGSLGFPPEMCG
jgi:hypothetical protein